MHNDPLHSDDAAKTYQKYFLVYSFLGVVLISAGTLAHGIGSLPTGAYNVMKDPIGAYDLQEVGWIILGISTCLIVIDCLRSAIKENRRVLGLK